MNKEFYEYISECIKHVTLYNTVYPKTFTIMKINTCDPIDTVSIGSGSLDTTIYRDGEFVCIDVLSTNFAKPQTPVETPVDMVLYKTTDSYRDPVLSNMSNR